MGLMYKRHLNDTKVPFYPVDIGKRRIQLGHDMLHLYLLGATCHDRVGSFFCQCPPGKTGLLCHLNDACTSNPCHEGAICETSPIDGSYLCSCPSGFKGTNCTEDIDECLEGSPCEHGGSCVNRK